jgi:hypothetical protein
MRLVGGCLHSVRCRVVRQKNGMIHLPDHAFFNFEGKRSLPLPVFFGLFLGGHGDR